MTFKPAEEDGFQIGAGRGVHSRPPVGVGRACAVSQEHFVAVRRPSGTGGRAAATPAARADMRKAVKRRGGMAGGRNRARGEVREARDPGGEVRASQAPAGILRVCITAYSQAP